MATFTLEQTVGLKWQTRHLILRTFEAMGADMEANVADLKLEGFDLLTFALPLLKASDGEIGKKGRSMALKEAKDASLVTLSDEGLFKLTGKGKECAHRLTEAFAAFRQLEAPKRVRGKDYPLDNKWIPLAMREVEQPAEEAA